MSTLLTLALLTTAQAKDNSGRVGIGADHGLAQSPGFSIVYQNSQTFGVQLILSSGFARNAVGTNTLATQNLALNLRGNLGVAFSETADLGFVFGVGSRLDSTAVDGTRVSSQRILIVEAALRPQWFVTEHLSIHTQIGVAISLIDSRNELTGINTSLTTVDFLRAGDLLGGAGFTFWL